MAFPRTLLRWAARLAILAGIAAAGYYGWRMWQGANVKTLDDRYQFEEVSRGDVTQTVTANGTLNPVVLVNVGTQVSGTVTRLYADFNATVKAGQVLLELDPTLFRAAVEQSRGNVANAEAALRLARANERRVRELFAQEYVSQQDLDQAVQAREAAEAQVRSARGQLARDEANVGYSVIRSPVSGTVVSRQVDVGQTVAASFQTPTLFQIAQDLTKMQINTNVAEADIGKIRTGMPVRFTVDAFPDRRFEGTVQQIRLNPIVQQNVVTYNVVVSVDNPERVLLPGMTAYISVDVDQRRDVLLVPTAALRFRPRDTAPESRKPGAPSARGAKSRPAGPRVYVARGQELVPVAIQVGLSDGKLAQVTGGELNAGDRVAVQNKLANGGGGTAGGGPTRLRSF
jgi:HlyD family secretion protein